MVKTTVYLDEAEAEALRRLATASGRSQAELIREAVARLTSSAPPTRRRLHSARAGTSDGSVNGRNFDEALRQEFGQRLDPSNRS